MIWYIPSVALIAVDVANIGKVLRDVAALATSVNMTNLSAGGLVASASNALDASEHARARSLAIQEATHGIVAFKVNLGTWPRSTPLAWIEQYDVSSAVRQIVPELEDVTIEQALNREARVLTLTLASLVPADLGVSIVASLSVATQLLSNHSRARRNNHAPAQHLPSLFAELKRRNAQLYGNVSFAVAQAPFYVAQSLHLPAAVQDMLYMVSAGLDPGRMYQLSSDNIGAQAQKVQCTTVLAGNGTRVRRAAAGQPVSEPHSTRVCSTNRFIGHATFYREEITHVCGNIIKLT